MVLCSREPRKKFIVWNEKADNANLKCFGVPLFVCVCVRVSNGQVTLHNELFRVLLQAWKVIAL